MIARVSVFRNGYVINPPRQPVRIDLQTAHRAAELSRPQKSLTFPHSSQANLPPMLHLLFALLATASNAS